MLIGQSDLMCASTSGSVQIRRVESRPVINMAGDVLPELMLLHSRYTLFSFAGTGVVFYSCLLGDNVTSCAYRKKRSRIRSCQSSRPTSRFYYWYMYFLIICWCSLWAGAFCFYRRCTRCVYFGLTSDHSDSLWRFSHTSITVGCVCVCVSTHPYSQHIY